MGARLSNAANTACCRVLPPQLGRHYRSSDGAMAIGATWTASGRRKQLGTGGNLAYRHGHPAAARWLHIARSDVGQRLERDALRNLGVDVGFGSWPCKKALTEAQFVGPGGEAHFCAALAYALIAAMSGRIPLMFITRGQHPCL